MAISIKEDIFRFQVAVDDAMPMEVFKRKDQFCDVELGTLFVEAPFSLEVPEEFAAGHEACDEKEIGGGLEGEFETDDERGFRHRGADKDITFANGVCDFFLLDYNFFR